MTISKDRVKPSPYPNSWNLSEIFTYAIVYGIYLAASTVIFFAVIVKTTFFQDKFGVQQFEYRSESDIQIPDGMIQYCIQLYICKYQQ